MKATFLRVSEGGEIAVSGGIANTDSFESSFLEVSNPDFLLYRDFIPWAYDSDLRNRVGTEGLYPIQGLEFEVKEVLSDGWVPSYNNPDNHNLEPNAEPTFVAIVSLVEPSKEWEKEAIGTETENNWHNVTDPEWSVIANAFKSYTIEGAVKWLSYQGYKIIKPQDMERLGEKTEAFEGVLPFIKWYSGMEDVKIRHAYERYKKEVLKD